jgi:hypothetical protein
VIHISDAFQFNITCCYATSSQSLAVPNFFAAVAAAAVRHFSCSDKVRLDYAQVMLPLRQLMMVDAQLLDRNLVLF